MTITSRSGRHLLTASTILVLVAASGCGDEQRRDLGEEDTRAALQERVAQVVENEGLALDGDLECSGDIGADSAVTSTCTGTTTSAAAIVASFTGTADVDAETCTARLVVEVDGEVVLDEPDADCFAVSQ